MLDSLPAGNFSDHRDRPLTGSRTVHLPIRVRLTSFPNQPRATAITGTAGGSVKRQQSASGLPDAVITVWERTTVQTCVI